MLRGKGAIGIGATPSIEREYIFDDCVGDDTKTESSRFNGLPDVSAVLCVNL